KVALHARQHRAIQAWIPEGATRHPNARTRELDTLALVDEGGILVLEAGGRRVSLVFGPAPYEGLVLDHPRGIAPAALLPVQDVPADVEEQVARADETLARVLASPGRLTDPDELPRSARPS